MTARSTPVRRTQSGGMPSMPAERSLRAALQTWREVYGVPGVALALVRRDRRSLELLEGYGELEHERPVRADHRFQIGSIGKSFTAIALLRLAERGLVDPQARVRRYLPWFRAGETGDAITIHHLLTHTAGLPMGADFSDASGFDAWALRDLPTRPPGERYWYSNVGYKALGLVLESITGRSYGEVIRREILDPLGMSGTCPVVTFADRLLLAPGYEPEPDVYPLSRAARVRAPYIEVATGDGSVAADIGDMARYVRMLLVDDRTEHPRILRRSSWVEFFGRHARTAGGHWYGYGMGSRTVDRRAVFGHAGDMLGYRASLVGDHTAGIGVVVLCGLRGAPTAVIARHALRVAWADAEGRDHPRFDPYEGVDLARYTGDYGGPDGILRVRMDGSRAWLDREGTTHELIPREEDAFEVDDPTLGRFLLRFHRDRDGAVSRATHGTGTFLRGSSRDDPTRTDRGRLGARAAFIGRYRSHNPWRRSLDVLHRAGRLWLVDADGEEDPLVRLGAGHFRPGSAPNPEIVAFDAVVDGRALRATASGHPYYRDAALRPSSANARPSVR